MSGAPPGLDFRHAYARLVASLSRRVGARHLAATEDAVQSALAAAVERWPRDGVPADPLAWLYRVAHDALVGELRTEAGRRRIEASSHFAASPIAASHRAPDPAEAAGAEPGGERLSREMDDDLLRMLFLCCDPAVPAGSQLVFALKVLCGFSVPEIAQRLFTTAANVHKRLARARQRLRTLGVRLDGLRPDEYVARLPDVHRILYVLFTEGYLVSDPGAPDPDTRPPHPPPAIRTELCAEAIRLGEVLAAHPLGAAPETYALLALMHLHAARARGRVDADGGLLLLEQQDRSRWDAQGIARGLAWLARSAAGDTYSRWHAEAGIAAEHCLAPTFAATRWDRVVAGYARLERLAPSALHRLNRAVATAEWQGPAAGLAVLDAGTPPTWLAGSCLWSAVRADLHRRCGDADAAAHYRRLAVESAPSPAVRALLVRRLGAPGPD